MHKCSSGNKNSDVSVDESSLSVKHLTNLGFSRSRYRHAYYILKGFLHYYWFNEDNVPNAWLDGRTVEFRQKDDIPSGVVFDV